MDSWLRSNNDGCIINVLISPQAKKNQIIGLHNNQIKIKITAPPVDGKANENVVLFLAEVLSVRSTNLEIIKGHTSRQKQILLKGLTAEQVQEALKKFL